jgi:hypothetical protein
VLGGEVVDVLVRADREVWREKRDVSIVGKREVGRDWDWWRVAIHAERVVLGFSSAHPDEGRVASLQDISRDLIRRLVKVVVTILPDQIRSQDRWFLPMLISWDRYDSDSLRR